MGHQWNVEPSIADIVVWRSGSEGFDHDAHDFDLLREALTATELLPAVADPAADLTVFAPTDGAFADLAVALGFDGEPRDEAAVFTFLAGATGFVSAEEPGLLADVLLYHVAFEGRTVATLQEQGTVTTLLGTSITVDGVELIDQDPDLENPEFVPWATDIEASNGIVQVIDKVLLPVDVDEAVAQPTLAELVVGASGAEGFDHDAGDFDILRESLVATGLVDAVADPDTELTVFAPTDGAFGHLAAALGFHGHPGDEAAVFDFLAGATGFESAESPGLLDDILLYHVAAGEQRLADLREAGSVETLEGGSVHVWWDMLGDKDYDVEDPQFIDGLVDLEASNGVAHAIDGVLLPTDL